MTLEEAPSLVGSTVLNGKLAVERELGEGGMGVVYQVTHLLTSHRRALKVLHPQLARSPQVVERFMREASVAGRLDCARVVETFDAGVLESGAPYVLMELLEGESLQERLEADGSLSPSVITRFAIEACEGLVAAHAAGIVHRDLKPENLFVVRDPDGGEHIKLLDFGISKFLGAGESLTVDGHLLGTPMYMSPEQTEGAEQADARSDLYAVGVILFEALCGRRPFSASSLPRLLIEVHGGEHPPLMELAPELDPALAAVVERAMARAPDDRYPSATAMIRALEPFVGDGRSASELHTLASLPPESNAGEDPEGAARAPEPPSVAQPAAAPKRGARYAAMAAFGAVTLLAVGGALWVLSSPTPRPSTDDSEQAIAAEPTAERSEPLADDPAGTDRNPQRNAPPPDSTPVVEPASPTVTVRDTPPAPVEAERPRRPTPEPHGRVEEHGLDSENPY